MKDLTYIDQEGLQRFLQRKGIEPDQAFLDQLELQFKELVAESIRVHKNRNRLAKIDAEKDQVDAVSVLSAEQIQRLPRWVRDEIESSKVVGKSGQVIQVPDGRKYHIGNPLNDLSGGEWTYFLTSVINTRYPTSGPESYAHEIRKAHPSPKPPQLMRQIIEFFTHENEWVLDYFAGVGGTLLGSSLSNRRAVGIDLNENYLDLYREASKSLGLKAQQTIQGDSLQLLKSGKQILKKTSGEPFSLILIDPPYGDMMNRAKTGEAAKKGKSTEPTPFTSLENDLGNLDLESFYVQFRTSVVDSLKLLKLKGHVVVFIKDLQPNKDSNNLLHARLIEDISSISGVQYLGTKIWADQGVNLYPYGYPYAYVPNQIHQYILVFKKVSEDD